MHGSFSNHSMWSQWSTHSVHIYTNGKWWNESKPPETNEINQNWRKIQKEYVQNKNKTSEQENGVKKSWTIIRMRQCKRKIGFDFPLPRRDGENFKQPIILSQHPTSRFCEIKITKLASLSLKYFCNFVSTINRWTTAEWTKQNVLLAIVHILRSRNN